MTGLMAVPSSQSNSPPAKGRWRTMWRNTTGGEAGVTLQRRCVTGGPQSDPAAGRPDAPPASSRDPHAGTSPHSAREELEHVGRDLLTVGLVEQFVARARIEPHVNLTEPRLGVSPPDRFDAGAAFAPDRILTA